MSSGSILKPFWPLLKLLQFFGVCPIKKNGDIPCGYQAISSGAYLSLVLLVQIVEYSSFMGAASYLMVVSNLNLTEIKTFMLDGAESSLDIFCVSGVTCTMCFVSYAIIIGNFIFKHNFIELLELLKEWPKNLQSGSKWKRKYHLIFVMLSWILTQIGVLSPSFFISEPGIDLLSIFIFSTLVMITMIIQNSPILGFLILFSEACYQLHICISMLIKKILKSKLQLHDDQKTIEDYTRLLKNCLKKTNETFSTLLFWITISYLIAMIFTAYFAISFFFHTSGGILTASKVARISSFVFSTISMISILGFINFLSQEITEHLHELKDCILELDGNEKWRIITIQRIDSFNGFDACGFFTLGRPLLTSIVANFTTFLIVLIQFKLGENT